MSEVITEADLFYTNHPFVLLNKYSPSQLENWFGPSDRPLDNVFMYKSQLLNDIWQKYCRVDLVKWDPMPDAIFFDYCSQKFLSLNQFMKNIDNYSLMALQRLQLQLTPTYLRWISNRSQADLEPFHILLERINQKVQKAMGNFLVV